MCCLFPQNQQFVFLPPTHSVFLSQQAQPQILLGMKGSREQSSQSSHHLVHRFQPQSLWTPAENGEQQHRDGGSPSWVLSSPGYPVPEWL